MPKRICNKCEKKKTSHDFYDDSRNTCKECKKKYTKDRYQASKDNAKYVKSGKCKEPENGQQLGGLSRPNYHMVFVTSL